MSKKLIQMMDIAPELATDDSALDTLVGIACRNIHPDAEEWLIKVEKDIQSFTTEMVPVRIILEVPDEFVDAVDTGLDHDLHGVSE